MRLLIYTRQSTARLTYTFDFILGELLGIEFDFTSDKNAFSSFAGPKMSYATKPIGSELFFECAAVLYETDITMQPIDFVEDQNTIGFYPLSAPSALPFDIFASAFVMISCYNEYLLHKKDKYHRYRSSQSLNYIGGFLGKPMINYYALRLKELLTAKYQGLKFKENKFEYIAAFDIDMAYSYRGKGVKDNLKAFAKSLFMSDFGAMNEQYKVMFRNKTDPFDTYDELAAVCNKYSIKSRFFFQTSDKSEFDNNISHNFRPLKETMRKLAKKSELGIHLSYKGHNVVEIISEEVQRLEHITGIKISASCFQQLRFTLPGSYLNLAKTGLTDDYSMGYATKVGFRAGTCTPFYFFDVINNERTNIKIHPFAFIDSTLANYNKLTAQESLEKILRLMKWVKEVEGPFIGFWHNSSFVEKGIWRGWKTVFETVAKEASLITEIA